jgi:phosphoribosylformylglycinamidine synthase
LICSAHDVSEGGIFITLTESGFNRNLGFKINTNKNFRKDAWLFGEAQSRVIVSVASNKVMAFEASLKASNASFELLGNVTENGIQIDDENWGDIKEWSEKYDHAIGNLLAGHDSEQALITL